tara:strand:+ start:1278 stop:2135 length:858 start_codon:yes stop_codon:yes gene_type:complete
MNIWDKLSSIDRRWVFLAMAIFVAWPVLKPLGLPVTTTKEVEDIHAFVDQLDGENPIILGLDYGPSTAPELTPMAKAVITHAFSKGIPVIGVSLAPDAPGVANDIMKWSESELGAVQGKDIAYLGYKVGTLNVILQMGQGISKAFPKDYYGKPTDELPIMKGISTLKDAAIVIGLEATAISDLWIQYAGDQMGVPVGIGMTAVSAPEAYVFYQSGQIVGLMGGMKGGAEYELLVDAPGSAVQGMDAQSLGHIVIIVFIILGNLGYFLGQKGQDVSRLETLREDKK